MAASEAEDMSDHPQIHPQRHSKWKQNKIVNNADVIVRRDIVGATSDTYSENEAVGDQGCTASASKSCSNTRTTKTKTKQQSASPSSSQKPSGSSGWTTMPPKTSKGYRPTAGLRGMFDKGLCCPFFKKKISKKSKKKKY
jgi:hypothetical protein